jgi:hypothetical protein
VPVAEKIDELCGLILDEITALGGSYERKPKVDVDEEMGSGKPSFDYDSTKQYNNLCFYGHKPH